MKIIYNLSFLTTFLFCSYASFGQLKYSLDSISVNWGHGGNKQIVTQKDSEGYWLSKVWYQFENGVINESIERKFDRNLYSDKSTKIQEITTCYLDYDTCLITERQEFNQFGQSQTYINRSIRIDENSLNFKIESDFRNVHNSVLNSDGRLESTISFAIHHLTNDTFSTVRYDYFYDVIGNIDSIHIRYPTTSGWGLNSREICEYPSQDKLICNTYSLGQLDVRNVEYLRFNGRKEIAFESNYKLRSNLTGFDTVLTILIDGEFANNVYTRISKVYEIGEPEKIREYKEFVLDDGFTPDSISDEGITYKYYYAEQVSSIQFPKFSDQFSLFPNPAKTGVTISFYGEKPMKIGDYKIFNSLGEAVKEGTEVNNNWISLEEVPNGLYYIWFKNGAKKTFIIQR